METCVLYLIGENTLTGCHTEMSLLINTPSVLLSPNENSERKHSDGKVPHPPRQLHHDCFADQTLLPLWSKEIFTCGDSSVWNIWVMKKLWWAVSVPLFSCVQSGSTNTDTSNFEATIWEAGTTWPQISPAHFKCEYQLWARSYQLIYIYICVCVAENLNYELRRPEAEEGR